MATNCLIGLASWQKAAGPDNSGFFQRLKDSGEQLVTVLLTDRLRVLARPFRRRELPMNGVLVTMWTLERRICLGSVFRQFNLRRRGQNHFAAMAAMVEAIARAGRQRGISRRKLRRILLG